MLRFALRRLLGIVPILVGVTLASFALLSYVPDPAEDPSVVTSLGAARALELRRSRFLDLPRFFNEHPADVVARVDEALGSLMAGGARDDHARATLVRLGGAALPHLLPRLDGLEPAARARVAIALAPIATRMGLGARDALDPALAVAFWNRLWTDRAIDYRPANARRAVRRLALHGTFTREADVLALDTYALEPLVEALAELSEPGRGPPELAAPEARLDAVRRLVAAAARITERDDVVAHGASLDDALACVRRWRDFWLVHRADYTAYVGAARFFAMLTDTRYARWAERALLLGWDAREADPSVFRRLLRRALPTGLITAGALAFAYAAALALGLFSALRAGARQNAALLGAALTLYATPAALLAAALAHLGGPRHALALCALGAGLLASPLAQARALALEVARGARPLPARGPAGGARPFDLWSRARPPAGAGRALRHVLLPILALAGAELPTALGGAFVVEKILGIEGLGEETLRAVQTHDVAWLVALAFSTALATTLTSLAIDVATAALDPSLAPGALRPEGRLS